MNRLSRFVLLAAATSANVALPAQYTEDRDNRVPTASFWYYNATAATVSSIASNYRIVDLEVVATSPTLRFTVAYVPNTGSYAKGWWWYYNATGADVTRLINQNRARLTDIEVYDTPSGQRFAVLMEANSTNGKGWWWYYGTSLSNIMSLAATNGARVVDLESYAVGNTTYYAAIMLRNTGKDAKTWWAYGNISAASVNSLLSSNGARIWDLDRRSNGNYDLVMVRFTGEQYWYWYGRTAAQVNQIALQYGARLIDVHQYNTIAGPRFDVVYLNSVNALSARVRDLMLARTNGSMGVHLRRIPTTGSGFELAGINQTTRYEPASTLKTLHHVTMLRDVYVKQLSLQSNYSVIYHTPSGSCPVTRTPYSLPLQEILRGMMQDSNNSYTRVITDLYTMAGLTSSAASLGMSNTAIHRHMGCAPLTNYSTLNDLATLHERVIRGYVGAQRGNFYALMNNGVSSGLRAVVSSEAAKLSMTAAQVNSFVANMQVTGKGGNDGVGGLYNRSWYGYVKLPIWRNGGMAGQEYATGAWVNNSTNDSNAANAVGIASVEILRDEIRACLLTLKNHVFGTMTPYGASCGGALTAFAHTASGVAEIGQRVSYLLVGVRKGAQLASLKIGASNTSWNRIPLPLHLAFLGAPGCYWRTDSLVELNLTAVDGRAAFTATIPTDKSLIGLVLHTQFLVVDPGANAANLTATNGITTRIGGQR